MTETAFESWTSFTNYPNPQSSFSSTDTNFTSNNHHLHSFTTNRMFSTVFTTARHFSESSAQTVQFFYTLRFNCITSKPTTGDHIVTEADNSCCYTWSLPDNFDTCALTTGRGFTRSAAPPHYCWRHKYLHIVVLYRGRKAQAVAELRLVHWTPILSP